MKYPRRSYFALCTASALFFCGCSESSSSNEKMTQAVHQAKRGNWQSAENTAAELSAKSPKAVTPMLLMALAYEKRGDLDKALDLARQCAAAAPDDFTAQYTFGRLSAGNPLRYSESFAILEKALTLRPGDSDTLVLLCNLGMQLKHPNTDRYLAQLNEKEEFQRSAQFNYQLGWRQAEKKNGKAAVEYLWRAVRLGGLQNPELPLNAARCIDSNGLSRKDAVKFYNLFIEHPAKKDPEKLKEAETRVRVLSGRR